VANITPDRIGERMIDASSLQEAGHKSNAKSSRNDRAPNESSRAEQLHNLVFSR